MKMFKTLLNLLSPKPVDAELEKMKRKYLGVEFFDRGVKTAERKIFWVGRDKFNPHEFRFGVEALNTGKKYFTHIDNINV